MAVRAPDDGELRSLPSAVALTVASALLWGVAHLVAGRTRAGVALLALQAGLVTITLVALTALRLRLLPLAVQPGWLTALIVAMPVIGAIWVAVVVCSYRVVRPADAAGPGRVLAAAVVTALCAAIAVPFAHTARLAYVSRDMLVTLFAPDEQGDDPWRGRSRVSILLIGADAAKNRPGARTDSMTVATVDVRTGRTVLFGLPRNLERPPMPGPARRWFPFGFTGDGTARTPGLLNEVHQWAEDHPEVLPDVPDGRRGPTLLKQTAELILGIPVDHYVMVDMRGFAELIDAIGGVTVTIESDIPYGRQGNVLRAGRRRLSGTEALWYGRSRSDSNDYVRMARQKCLLYALARQADPAAVIKGFERIAEAAKRHVSTDIPRDMLPALADLAARMDAAELRTLQFVPPLIDPSAPNWYLIRRKVAEALDDEGDRPRRRSPAGATPRPSPAPDRPARLAALCG